MKWNHEQLNHIAFQENYKSIHNILLLYLWSDLSLFDFGSKLILLCTHYSKQQIYLGEIQNIKTN